MSDYQAFLDSKSTACPPVGFDPQQFTAHGCGMGKTHQLAVGACGL